MPTTKQGMGEPQAQIILVVRAFEETDRHGRLLPLHAREAATRRAVMVTGVTEWSGKVSEISEHRRSETAFRRARLLFDGLRRRFPVLRRIFRVARKSSEIGVVSALAMVALGAAGSLLAPPRRPDAVPWFLLALFAWNLLVYTLLLARPWTGASRDGLARCLTDPFLKAALWRALRTWRRAHGKTSPEARLVAESLVRFAALWHRVAETLMARRIKLFFHLCAILVVAGAVGGIALRDGRLSLRVLVAAAVVLVGLPRGVLALRERWRVARLAGSLSVSLKSAYFRRVFAPWRGATKRVEVLSYGYRPLPGALAALRTLLHDFFGARAGIRLRDPLPEGSDAAAVLPSREWARDEPGGEELCRVVLFSLTDTPRPGVHGVFLDKLKAATDSRLDRLVLMIDGSGPAARSQTEERRRELFRGWEKCASASGLKVVELNLERPLTDFSVSEEMIATLRAGLWPAPASTVET